MTTLSTSIDVVNLSDGKMLYATCSTAAATADKVATLSPTAPVTLYTGLTVAVKFSEANTVATPTLNLNSTGAKKIFHNGSALDANYPWFASEEVMLVYDAALDSSAGGWYMAGHQSKLTTLTTSTAVFYHPYNDLTQGVRIGTYTYGHSETGVQIVQNSKLRALYGSAAYFFGNANGGDTTSVTYPYTKVDSTGFYAYSTAAYPYVKVTADGFFAYQSSTKYVKIDSNGFYAYYDANNYATVGSTGMKIYAGGYLKTEVLSTATNIYGGSSSSGAYPKATVASGGLYFYSDANNYTKVTQYGMYQYENNVEKTSVVMTKNETACYLTLESQDAITFSVGSGSNKAGGSFINTTIGGMAVKGWHLDGSVTVQNRIVTEDGNIKAVGGYLISENNGNTVTIGSQNGSWCHFTNSANINFYFNKSVYVDGDIYKYNGAKVSYEGHGHDGTYLKLSGGTLTGALTLANNTYNNVGDDVAIGDINSAGTLGVKGLNGRTTINLVERSAGEGSHVIGVGRSDSWRNVAISQLATFEMTKAAAAGWCAAVGIPTRGGGKWDIGNYDTETLVFSYISKAHIDNGTNGTSQVHLRTTGGTIALTSEVDSLASSHGTAINNINAKKIIANGKGQTSGSKGDIATKTAVTHSFTWNLSSGYQNWSGLYMVTTNHENMLTCNRVNYNPRFVNHGSSAATATTITAGLYELKWA